MFKSKSENLNLCKDSVKNLVKVDDVDWLANYEIDLR